MRLVAVAAALAAGVVMAGAASADTMVCRMDASGNCWAEFHDATGRTYSRLLNDTESRSDPVVIPAPIRRTCPPGRTEVTVGTVASHFLDVHKCAAVGDLPDPE